MTVWGFVDGNDIIGLIPVNTADNFLHLGISLAGIAAGLLSRASDASRTSPTARPAG